MIGYKTGQKSDRFEDVFFYGFSRIKRHAVQKPISEI